MSRVITFSQVFPKGHARQGEPTYFAEKIMAGLADHFTGWEMPKDFTKYDWQQYYNCNMFKKFHTIRAGKRWKMGDKFSPRVWSGRPYASKQLCFSEDLTICAVYDFKFDGTNYFIDGKKHPLLALAIVAHQDGLKLSDLVQWFREPFEGQIICWIPVYY